MFVHRGQTSHLGGEANNSWSLFVTERKLLALRAVTQLGLKAFKFPKYLCKSHYILLTVVSTFIFIRNTAQACLTWEDILTENPTDMFALKMAHDSYFYLGYQAQIRDSIARVLPRWNESMPLYG